mgnify:CR=1 FL=1
MVLIEPLFVHFEMFFKELCVIDHQKVDSCVKSSSFVIESQRKVPSQLSNISVFQVRERNSIFFSHIYLINVPFLGNLMKLRDIALNLRRLKSIKSRLNIYLRNRSIHKSETAVRMRPHPHIRKLVRHTRTINITVHFFILEDFTNLITSRMIIPQRVNVIDVIRKDYVLLISRKVMHRFH